MRSNRLMKLSAAAVIAAGVAGAALAQGGPGRMMEERGGGWGWGMWGNDGSGWGMGMGMWGRGPWARGGSDWMLDRIEGRLAFLKTELKITEAQTAAWNQLADAIRTAAKHHNERMKSVVSGDQRSKSLPERLDAQEQFISIRLEEIKQIKGSLKSLYDVLSDAQKKEADDMAIPMVGMMGGPLG
jgi:LTXXQ motif family protein